MRVGTLKVVLMNTDKYFLMSVYLLILFGMEKFTSAMEEIYYLVKL
jgi:hypothetical protein